jgi:hypothetical protein
MLVGLWDVLGRFVVEAICFVNVFVRPFAGIGKVVEREEGAGVEILDQVLL